MTDNDILNKEPKARRTPFTVPDGYFAQLQSEVMAAIPQTEADVTESFTQVVAMKPRHSRLRPLMTAAASVCLAVFAASAWYFFTAEGNSQTLAESSEFHEMLSDYDGAADYLMFDNDDLYSYMAQE